MLGSLDAFFRFGFALEQSILLMLVQSNHCYERVFGKNAFRPSFFVNSKNTSYDARLRSPFINKLSKLVAPIRFSTAKKCFIPGKFRQHEGNISGILEREITPKGTHSTRSSFVFPNLKPILKYFR